MGLNSIHDPQIRTNFQFSANRDFNRLNGYGLSWFAIVFGGLISVGLAAAGVAFVRRVWTLSMVFVEVGEKGFSVSTGDRPQIYVWDQIESVTETHLFERPPVLTFPAVLLLPKIKSKNYLVKSEIHKDLMIDGNFLRRHIEFAELIKPEVERIGAPWEIFEEHG